MSNRSILGLIGLAVVIFLLTQTFYTVDPTSQVLVRQFGALVGKPKTEPGLYAKIPLVQDIVRIDRRLLDYEADEFEVIAGDQKRLVVDAFARFRITDARLFSDVDGPVVEAREAVDDAELELEFGRDLRKSLTTDIDILRSLNANVRAEVHHA